jgi:hypothetical protein
MSPARMCRTVMSLSSFQIALGRTVRASTAQLDDLNLSSEERIRLPRLLASSGFRFTASIQRSWCEGRAAKGALLTLSVLPRAQRRQLVGEWVERGGGTNSFFAAEADAFLDFLAPRLPDPSHALSLCRFERAALCVEQVAARFVPPTGAALDNATGRLRTGRHAALVTFCAEPDQLLAALNGDAPLPPVSETMFPILVAPGLVDLTGPAEITEAALWQSLERSPTVSDLLRDGHSRDTIRMFLAVGAAESI